jgi:hypothetical protein
MQTCECGVVLSKKFNLERHLLSRNHDLNMRCLGYLVLNGDGMYECETCNYSSSIKDSFRKHVMSARHIAAKERESAAAAAAAEDSAPVPIASTLSAAAVPATELQNEFVKPVMLVEVMEMFLNFMKNEKENQQIQQTEMFKAFADRIMAHQAQQSVHGSHNTANNDHSNTTNNDHSNNTTNNDNSTNNTTTTTHHKKKFNLNFFLNEECKNAMNLSDFIKELVVNMEDLEYICEAGYAEGMSKIITKAINRKHKTERPIHCSDSKRETMHVKHDDVWQKDSNKEECERLIDHITSKNYKFMKKWCDEHPGYIVSDSPEYDKWYGITRALCNTDPKAKKKLLRHLALVTEIEKDDDEDNL